MCTVLLYITLQQSIKLLIIEFQSYGKRARFQKSGGGGHHALFCSPVAGLDVDNLLLIFYSRLNKTSIIVNYKLIVTL